MIYLELLKPQGIDFPQYYGAVRTLLSGLNPYVRILTYAGPFNYPPTAFLVLYWFGLIPVVWAYAIWNLLSFGAYLLTIFLLVRIRGKVTLVKYLGVVFLLTVPFFPEKFNLGNGQINNFILLFVVLSFVFQTTRTKLSAFFSSLATAVKLVPGIFLLDKVLLGDKKYLGKFFGWTVVFLALSLVFVPVNFQAEYFGKVFFQAFPVGGKAVYYNQSLTGFFARAFAQPQIAQYLSWLGSVVLLGATVYRYRKLSVAERFSALSCLYLMLNPLAWQHHFVFASIPLILLADFNGSRTAKTDTDWKRVLIIGVSYMLIAWNFKNPGAIDWPFRFLLSNQFLGIFLLWVLVIGGKWASRAIGVMWVIGVVTGYVLIMVCRARFCF